MRRAVIIDNSLYLLIIKERDRLQKIEDKKIRAKKKKYSIIEASKILARRIN